MAITSTNPFLTTPAPKTGGTTTSATAPTSGMLPLTSVTSNTTPAPVPTSASFGTLPLGQTAKGPNPSGSNPTTLSPQYASGINGAGKTTTSSIPAGYSYNAQGQLTNNQGQIYQPPAASAPSTTASTTAISTSPTNNSQTGGIALPTTPNQPAPTPTNPQPQYNSSNPTTLQSLLNQTANGASQPSQAYTDAYNKAQSILGQQEQLQENLGTQTSNIEGSPIDLSLATGQEGILNRLYTAKNAALSSQFQGATNLISGANTQQQTQQTGLLGAAGLLSPVTQYGALTNPATGQPISGGTASSPLPASATSFIGNLAQQVQNGQMTRDQAESELSAYGPAGLQALNSALGPNFNTNASNASATTTQQGQQLQTQASSALQSLSTLQNLFNSLPGVQTGGIPATNAIANWISSQLGSGALSSYNTALADARAQLEGVLTATGATTPTGAQQMAETYLPDNMTPQQLQQNISTVQALIQQKVSSFTQSGQQTGQGVNSGTTGGTIQNTSSLYNL